MMTTLSTRAAALSLALLFTLGLNGCGKKDPKPEDTTIPTIESTEPTPTPEPNPTPAPTQPPLPLVAWGPGKVVVPNLFHPLKA